MYNYAMDYDAVLQGFFKQVQGTDDIRARSELFKLWKNCVNIRTEMDKEMVQCRRYQRVTPKYTELEAQLNEAIQNFEHWVTYARLLYA